jgi:hypothetical protein
MNSTQAATLSVEYREAVLFRILSGPFLRQADLLICLPTEDAILAVVKLGLVLEDPDLQDFVIPLLFDQEQFFQAMLEIQNGLEGLAEAEKLEDAWRQIWDFLSPVGQTALNLFSLPEP